MQETDGFEESVKVKGGLGKQNKDQRRAYQIIIIQQISTHEYVQIFMMILYIDYEQKLNLQFINISSMIFKKYFQEYDSQQDENYEPTAKENKIYDLQHQKRKTGKRHATKTAHELYLQIKNQYQQKQKQKQAIKKVQRQTANPIQLANTILNSQSIKPNKRITFAGKQYILNQQTGQLEAVERKNTAEVYEPIPGDIDLEALQIRSRHISYQYLNHVMQAIYNRSKKINAIGKSKLDWKGFVKQEGIQDKLHYNRKGGVIQNMEFIRNSR